MEDPTCGGLAIDITLEGGQIDENGRWDNYGAAALIGTIKYRHHTEDPRRGL